MLGKSFKSHAHCMYWHLSLLSALEISFSFGIQNYSFNTVGLTQIEKKIVGHASLHPFSFNHFLLDLNLSSSSRRHLPKVLMFYTSLLQILLSLPWLRDKLILMILSNYPQNYKCLCVCASRTCWLTCPYFKHPRSRVVREWGMEVGLWF